MGLLTFSINVTLDGCVDHQEGITDDETHAFFTRLMDEGVLECHTCLCTLDDMIGAETQKLEPLNTHKRGLMPQLFPSPEEVEA